MKSGLKKIVADVINCFGLRFEQAFMPAVNLL